MSHKLPNGVEGGKPNANRPKPPPPIGQPKDDGKHSDTNPNRNK